MGIVSERDNGHGTLRRKPECRDWKSDWEEREEDGEAANSCLSRLVVKRGKAARWVYRGAGAELRFLRRQEGL